jgi:transposase
MTDVVNRVSSQRRFLRLEPCAEKFACTVLRGLETSNGFWLPNHREDLKQWMMSLATADTTGIPIGLQLLSGNASDKETLVQQVREVIHQLDHPQKQRGISIADSGMYSEENMTWFDKAHVPWIARVPETSTRAKETVKQEPNEIQEGGKRQWWETTVTIGERTERWIVVRSEEGKARSLATMKRRAERERIQWEKRLKKLPTFSCEADAQKALQDLLTTAPSWLEIQGHLVSVKRRLLLPVDDHDKTFLCFR